MNKTNENLLVKKLLPTDLPLFKNLIRLFIEVFEEEQHGMASDTHLQKLLQDPHFHAFAVLTGDKLVGALTAYEMVKYYTERSELYIYDMAVDTRWQRKGIGRRLIGAVREFGEAHHISTVFVEAHSEDVEAVKFYQSVFPEAEKVDHFNLEIRPSSR